MKKKLSSILAAALLSLAACSQNSHDGNSSTSATSVSTENVTTSDVIVGEPSPTSERDAAKVSGFNNPIDGEPNSGHEAMSRAVVPEIATTGINTTYSDAVGYTKVFQSPSGNISCGFRLDALRCDVKSFRGEPGPSTAIITNEGVSDIRKTNDPGPGDIAYMQFDMEPMVLNYGETVQVRNQACTSQFEGVTCIDRYSNSGVFMSRESIEAF